MSVVPIYLITLEWSAGLCILQVARLNGFDFDVATVLRGGMGCAVVTAGVNVEIFAAVAAFR